MSDSGHRPKSFLDQKPWSWLFHHRPEFDAFDAKVADWMHRWGHFLHRIPLGLLFIWFGLLKVAGNESATSLIAKTVYFGDPTITVPILGLWEAMIGVCLLYKPLIRCGLLLLFIRLPGTALALIIQHEVCFERFPLVPTIHGQYLIKDLILFGAAAVIGGTVRLLEGDGVRH